MEDPIKTSINTLYLHICKKNIGYYGICTNNGIEAGSIHFFKFKIKKCEYINFHDLREDYMKMREIYEEKKKEYENYCKTKTIRVLNEEALNNFLWEKKRESRSYGNNYDENKLKQENQHKFMKEIINPEKDIEDLAFSEIENIFKKITNQSIMIEKRIIDENMKRGQEYNDKIENLLNIAVNKKFNDFMKENNYIAPKPDKFCKICNKTISYTNWSKHIISYKHNNANEVNEQKKAKSTKIICTCGAKVLPHNMDRHVETDKHKGIGPSKVFCECGVLYCSKFARRHLTSVKHSENMAIKAKNQNNQI